VLTGGGSNKISTQTLLILAVVVVVAFLIFRK
jgi:hypothetical protein